MASHAMQEPWPEDWFESVEACPLCGSAKLKPLIDGAQDWFFEAVPGAFAFARCGDCASLVLLRRPTAEHLGKAYAGYYTHGASDAAAPSKRGIAARIWRNCSRGYVQKAYGGSASLASFVAGATVSLFPERKLELDCWYRFLPPAPARVLDYGCGNGDFMLRAAALGHDVCGVDFDERAVATAAGRGLEVKNAADVDEAIFAEGFDCITANHVIEHVPDPSHLLARFAAWLRPGGRLYLETPNAQAAGLREFGRFWRGLEAPRHFCLPSRAALSRALHDAGFNRVEWHDRTSVGDGMARQASAAMQSNPGVAVGGPASDDFHGPEFLTVVAHRAE